MQFIKKILWVVMPRQMLYTDQVDSIIKDYLIDNSEWTRKEVDIPVSSFKTNIVYFYNQNKNSVIISTPLFVQPNENSYIACYQAAVQKIKEDLTREDFSLACILLGKGGGERHYMALYKDRSQYGTTNVFDSKISSPDLFFNSSDAPNVFEKIWNFFKVPIYSFALWAFGIGQQIKASFLGEEVTVFRLGTQSIFDGVSCGLHAAGAIMNVINSVDKGMCTSEDIVDSITSDTCLDLKAEEIFNNPIISPVNLKKRNPLSDLSALKKEQKEITITLRIVESHIEENNTNQLESENYSVSTRFR